MENVKICSCSFEAVIDNVVQKKHFFHHFLEILEVSASKPKEAFHVDWLWLINHDQMI